MRPLKTILLCATILSLAAGALAQQPPPPEPLTALSADMGLTGAGNSAAQQSPFPPRREQGTTIIEPGCVGERSACEVRLDMMFLTLGKAEDQPLILHQPTQTEWANVDDLHFNPELGPRVTLGYQTSDGPIFELGYFGIYNWNARLDLQSGDNMCLPRHFQDYTVDFADADRIQVNYTSKINSAEANLIYTRPTFPNVGVLVGVRFVKIDEEFYLQSLDLVDTTALYHGLSYYDIQTTNDLYGVQFGSTWRACFPRFDVRMAIKAGVFDDEAKQSQIVTDQNSLTVRRNVTSRSSRGVFLTEANFSLNYCLRGNTFLNIGYDLIWIDRLARAPDQLDFTLNDTSGTGVLFGKGALMHGPRIGFEARW
jgi:hypothetical protein